MQHRVHNVGRVIVVLLCMGALVVGAPLAAQPRTDPDALQTAFRDAAQEFGVPQSVLMAVAYNLSRWEQHDGRPSTTGGYGVMHLAAIADAAVHEGKGDGVARPALTGDDPQHNTLRTAARLLGIAPDVLKRDARQNVRGGAALLAAYTRERGSIPASAGDWYAAVARMGGSRSVVRMRSFADAVYRTVEQGVERTTTDGQHVRLVAESVEPDRDSVPVPPQVTPAQQAECPPELDCAFVPAAYEQNNPDDASDYGNYDLARREEDGLDIDYIVIHDTETPYDATIELFQNPLSYVSSHYVFRASDGDVTQMVLNKDISYTAGNYYVNMHSINLEHEGYALEGAAWYSEQMYQSSAALVRYLADRYDIPRDRAHIVGHDDVPAPIPSLQAGMHWDPGPFWDWQYYMTLIGAPIREHGPADSDIITIAPPFATNDLPFDDAPTQSSSFVYLHTEPRADAPLIGDAALGATGTRRANDWGDKAATGQQFYRFGQEGDWTGIHFGGQEAWFYNPTSKPVAVRARGTLVMPKEGLDSIPVYGRAYPEAEAYPDGITPAAIVPMQYTIPAGQRYVATALLNPDYYYAPTYTNDPANNTVVEGEDQYYRIFFGHRFMFVKASDVDVIEMHQTMLPIVVR